MRIAARFGYPVEAGGGTPAGAEAAARRLIDAGATALVSFGLAGGLDPALRPGEVIVPWAVLSNGGTWHADRSLAERFGGLTAHTILGGREVAATATEKRCVYLLTQAHAIDLESGAVAAAAAAHGLSFVVVRAICDPAERDLPPAALLALGPDGAINLWRVLRSVFGDPRQIAPLLALAHDARIARRALLGLAARVDAERRGEDA
ncbi:hypothetical protein [Rhodopila sp.]|uniref:phosphorylase family protein n=1 Tax=Rhodopila sp. TaxID=2480087 RepID=UPI003D0C5D1B